jgi:uncharacterized protein (TIRG00374 family)
MLVGAVFLWLAFRAVEYDGVVQLISAVSVSPLAVVILCTLMFLLIKSWRWQRLLSPLAGSRTIGSLLPAVTLGSAANYILPHFGEVLRIWAVGDKRGASRSSILATIALERVLDAAAICLAGASLVLFEAQAGDVNLAIQILAVGSTVCALIIVAVLRYPRFFLRFVASLADRYLPRFRSWVVQKTESAIDGLEGVRQPSELFLLLAISALQWGCMAACVAASMWAIGLDTSVGASTAVLILIVVGLVLPSAPGYFGTTQLAYLMALSPLGYDGDSAVAASLVYNVAVVVGIVAAAALLIHRLPMLYLVRRCVQAVRGS